MQGVGTRGHLGRPDAEGRRPDRMSTQQGIQNCDLRLVRPVPQTHQAHQAQSKILADGLTPKGFEGQKSHSNSKPTLIAVQNLLCHIIFI